MLNGVDAQVVFDALTILADVCELEGDPATWRPWPTTSASAYASSSTSTTRPDVRRC
jgi:hypothetical protein